MPYVRPALPVSLLSLVCLAAVGLGARPAAAQPAAQSAAQTTAATAAVAEGRFVRALTEHRLGNDTAAVRLLDAALALRPGDAAVLDALAEVYADLGRPTDALYHAGLAAAAAPAEAAVVLRLGTLQAAAGQREAALASVEAARRLAPTDAATLDALAGLHAAAGRADAESEALEARTALGATPEHWLRLAALYRDAREPGLEAAALRAADRLAPNTPAVRARLAASDPAPSAAVPAVPVPGDASPFASADAALAVAAADPRRLDAWAAALDALARTADPRAGDTADEATLLFPTVPSVLAPAAEAYLAAGRASDAARVARAGLAALADAGASADLRARLDRALAAATR